MVFAKAIGKLKSEQITPVPILCDDDSSFWNMGDTIINEMKKVFLVINLINSKYLIKYCIVIE